MVKSYRDFPKYFIGESDSARLIVEGYYPTRGNILRKIQFGEDGVYRARIGQAKDLGVELTGVDWIDDNEIWKKVPSYYEKILDSWGYLDVYDDTGKTMRISASVIRVYRAGDFGCLILVTGDTILENYYVSVEKVVEHEV